MNAITTTTSRASSTSWRRPSLPARLGIQLDLYRQSVAALGLAATLKLLYHHARGLRRPKSSTTVPLRLKGYPHPFHFRPGTADRLVIHQVFARDEYACVGDEQGVSLIVDCGANIGCASVYFLTRYPSARLVAIEADAGNAEVCRRNLAPFGDRARLIVAGVWPETTRLKVEHTGFGDGLEWSFHVRPARPDEPGDIDAISLTTLIPEEPDARIDLLKIDIEGAETELFAQGYTPWLSRTRTIAIELHNDQARTQFQKAVGPHARETLESGETTVARLAH